LIVEKRGYRDNRKEENFSVIHATFPLVCVGQGPENATRGG
jgi:hypothetical protein